MFILWQGQKAVLTIVEFEFLGTFCSKCQLVSTFSISSKFCVEKMASLLRPELQMGNM